MVSRIWFRKNRFSLKDKLQLPQKEKLLETSKKNLLSLLKISKKKWQLPVKTPNWKKLMNFQTVTLSPSETNDSDAQKSYSNPRSSVKKKKVSTNWPLNPSWSVTLTSEKIFTQTPLCLEVLPCSLESATVFKRKSPTSHHPPWLLRLLPHQRENTPSGLEDPSLHPYPLSKKCGSPKKNMTNLVLLLSTENVLKLTIEIVWSIRVCHRGLVTDSLKWILKLAPM